MSKLEARNLQKIIKKAKIIHGISLEVSSGEVVGLLGPNGAGKTTTFYMICGLILPNLGQVLLDGEDITKLSLSKRARAGIGIYRKKAAFLRT